MSRGKSLEFNNINSTLVSSTISRVIASDGDTDIKNTDDKETQQSLNRSDSLSVQQKLEQNSATKIDATTSVFDKNASIPVFSQEMK